MAQEDLKDLEELVAPELAGLFVELEVHFAMSWMLPLRSAAEVLEGVEATGSEEAEAQRSTC